MICERLPEASLTATMFSTSRASRSVVSAEMFDEVRPGNVVDHDRQIADCFGDRAKVRVESFLRRLVVIRSDCQHAVDAEFARDLRASNRDGG
jgi:hypothetical protein